MLHAAAADLVLVFHLVFIVYVVAGGFLTWRWAWTVALHVPCALWGAYVEFSGTICPLTPLEVSLRRMAGEDGYSGGFIEHYLLPVIYPSGLTPTVQMILGAVVVVVNLVAYGGLLLRRRR